MSKAIHLTGGKEASETARFVDMVDKFFDSLNVHNYVHGIHKRKFFQMPYTAAADYRLKVHTHVLVMCHTCVLYLSIHSSFAFFCVLHIC